MAIKHAKNLTEALNKVTPDFDFYSCLPDKETIDSVATAILSQVADIDSVSPKDRAMLFYPDIYADALMIFQSSRSDPTRLIRFYIVSILLDYKPYINKFASKLKTLGYNKDDMSAIFEFVTKNRFRFERLLDEADKKIADAVGKAEEQAEITEAIEKHDTLNPKLWTKKNTLKPSVKKKLTK